MTVDNPQHVSLEGAKFVACREALVTVAYEDGKHKNGDPKYSIGFGSQSPPPKPGDTITIEDAFARLRADIRTREAVLNRALVVEISQPAFDALFSLFYQSGTKALLAIADEFNIGDEIWAAREMINWNFGADRKPTAGHTKRRIREMIMAIDGYYGDISKVMVFDGNPREVKPYWLPFPEMEG